jgi:hypothetical protein
MICNNTNLAKQTKFCSREQKWSATHKFLLSIVNHEWNTWKPTTEFIHEWTRGQSEPANPTSTHHPLMIHLSWWIQTQLPTACNKVSSSGKWEVGLGFGGVSRVWWWSYYGGACPWSWTWDLPSSHCRHEVPLANCPVSLWLSLHLLQPRLGSLLDTQG